MNQYERKSQAVPPGPRLRRRFWIFIALFLLGTFSILFQYGSIMLGGTTASARSEASLSERGPILDRNGRILAMQTRLANVTIWRPEIPDVAALSKALGPLLDLDSEALARKIASSESDFIYAKKKIDQSAISAIETAKQEGKLPGVSIEPIVGRIYPEKKLASTLIGFVGDDNTGLAGIEYAYEHDLDAATASSYGDQVILTIDANIQHMLEEIAARTLAGNGAEAMMLLAMDPRNGDILAYVSLPDFDPNDIRSSTEESRMDRPAIWAYEPGSVFKLFSIASIMELGGITGTTTFNCNGHYERSFPSGETVTIKCSAGAHGTVTAREIITYSCNTGTAYASERVDSSAFAEALHRFGFGARTEIGLASETGGYLRPVERWSARSKPTVAIGQEVSVSALQILQASTAIANDGILVRPRVVSKIIGSDGKLKQDFSNNPTTRVISAATAQSIRSYMETAASPIGTGKRANIGDIAMGVKTGTAQLIDPKTKRYSDTDYVSSCIGILPIDSPELVIYSVLLRPKGDSYEGSRIAAPSVKEAADAIVDYMGIVRGRNQIATHGDTVVLNKGKTVAIGDTMPDLRGYSKRELLPLLSRKDLKVEITGEGWVKRQTPEPGAPITADTTLVLELE